MFTLKVIKIIVSILIIRELSSKSSAFLRLIMPIMAKLIGLYIPDRAVRPYFETIYNENCKCLRKT